MRGNSKGNVKEGQGKRIHVNKLGQSPQEERWSCMCLFHSQRMSAIARVNSGRGRDGRG